MKNKKLWILALGTCLCLSGAEARAQQVATPKVVGLNVMAAQGALLRAGLKCQVSGYITAPRKGMAGNVIGQKPDAGKRLPKGGVVALTVYSKSQQELVEEEMLKKMNERTKAASAQDKEKLKKLNDALKNVK